jgi:hypothetical protein
MGVESIMCKERCFAVMFMQEDRGRGDCISVLRIVGVFGTGERYDSYKEKANDRREGGTQREKQQKRRYILGKCGMRDNGEQESRESKSGDDYASSSGAL